VPFSPEDALTAHIKRIVKTSLGVEELPWQQMSLSIESDSDQSQLGIPGSDIPQSLLSSRFTGSPPMSG
jgi:hypothetical protein